jgi:hypothetical protein
VPNPVIIICSFSVSVEACKRNIKFNGSVACSKVESHLTDARVYMLMHPKEFDVVCICFFSRYMYLLKGSLYIYMASIDGFSEYAVKSKLSE